MGNGGFTNDQDGLYIDNTVFDQEKTNIAVAVNALDFNESAFELEDAACGTDAMSLLKKQWHAVTDTTVHFKDFYSENVDPFVSKVGKSINDVDGSVYDTLNCSGSYVPDNFHNALPPGQQAFVKPSGTFTPIERPEPTIKQKRANKLGLSEKDYQATLYIAGLCPGVSIPVDIIDLIDDYQKANQDKNIDSDELKKLIMDGVFVGLDVVTILKALRTTSKVAKVSKAGKAGKVAKVAEDTEKAVKAAENAEKAAKTAKAGEATLKTVDGAEDVVKGTEKAAKTAGEHADDAKKIVKKTSDKADDIAKYGDEASEKAGKASKLEKNPFDDFDVEDATNKQKGNYGEYLSDKNLTQNESLKNAGYDLESIGKDAPTSPDDKIKKGIDGLYRNNAYNANSTDGGKNIKYVIDESKFGKGSLSETNDGLQMSDDWLTGAKTNNNRILDAVNYDEELADDIEKALRRGEVDRVLSRVDKNGNVTTFRLNKKGEIIGTWP